MAKNLPGKNLPNGHLKEDKLIVKFSPAQMPGFIFLTCHQEILG